MQTVRVTTSQNIDIDYNVASFSDRVAARVIDYTIFLMVYWVVIIIFTATTYGTMQGNYNGQPNIFASTSMVVMIIIWLALCVFYDLFTEIFMKGQSVGKRSLKIRVISLSGARPTVGQYLLRWIFRILDFGITFGTAAVVTVAFTDNKQRIGDLVAGTAVVKTAPINKINDLVFSAPADDYEPVYTQVLQLTDQDILLIHDVVKNFNRTRNSSLVYRLAIRIKNFLHVTYPSTVNEYQFLEIIVNDYNYLIAHSGV